MPPADCLRKTTDNRILVIRNTLCGACMGNGLALTLCIRLMTRFGLRSALIRLIVLLLVPNSLLSPTCLLQLTLCSGLCPSCRIAYEFPWSFARIPLCSGLCSWLMFTL